MLKQKKRFFQCLLLASLVFILTSCATNTLPANQQDPYEHFNRKVFAFNNALDRAFFRPVAKVYDKVLPSPVKKGVYNFFNNIGDVTSAANEVLQLDFSQAIADLARVTINTIVGVGGLFDVATRLGLERDVEDFGMTLAHWGAKNTPYLVLPFLGPATIRDAVGLPINYLFLSPWGYIQSSEVQYTLAGLYYVQRRASLLIGDAVIDQAFDPYVFMRDAYLQRREFLIKENKQRVVDRYVADDGVKHRKTQTLKQSCIVY